MYRYILEHRCIKLVHLLPLIASQKKLNGVTNHLNYSRQSNLTISLLELASDHLNCPQTCRGTLVVIYVGGVVWSTSPLGSGVRGQSRVRRVAEGLASGTTAEAAEVAAEATATGGEVDETRERFESGGAAAGWFSQDVISDELSERLIRAKAVSSAVRWFSSMRAHDMLAASVQEAGQFGMGVDSIGATGDATGDAATADDEAHTNTVQSSGEMTLEKKKMSSPVPVASGAHIAETAEGSKGIVASTSTNSVKNDRTGTRAAAGAPDARASSSTAAEGSSGIVNVDNGRSASDNEAPRDGEGGKKRGKGGKNGKEGKGGGGSEVLGTASDEYVLIDISGLIFRSFYGMGALTGVVSCISELLLLYVCMCMNISECV